MHKLSMKLATFTYLNQLKPVEQAFVRDPDGYYIEFCGCEPLENYLEKKTQEAEHLINNFSAISVPMIYGERLKQLARDAKQTVKKEANEIMKVL